MMGSLFTSTLVHYSENNPALTAIIIYTAAPGTVTSSGNTVDVYSKQTLWTSNIREKHRKHTTSMSKANRCSCCPSHVLDANTQCPINPVLFGTSAGSTALFFPCENHVELLGTLRESSNLFWRIGLYSVRNAPCQGRARKWCWRKRAKCIWGFGETPVVVLLDHQYVPAPKYKQVSGRAHLCGVYFYILGPVAGSVSPAVSTSVFRVRRLED